MLPSRLRLPKDLQIFTEAAEMMIDIEAGIVAIRMLAVETRIVVVVVIVIEVLLVMGMAAAAGT